MKKLGIISEEATQYVTFIENEGLADLEVRGFESPEAARGHIGEVDIMMGLPSYLSSVLDEARQLKWVQSTSAGVEELCKSGLRRDYQLTNVKDVFGDIMSEYIFAYILGLERNLREFEGHQRRREWVRWDHYPYRRMSDLTLGVIGLGSIGRRIAESGAHFGMRVLGMKRSPESIAQVDEVFGLDQLAQFLPQVDYLVVVLPSTPETHHFVDQNFLNLMKPEAVLMNVGRGSTLKEVDLLAALDQGKIRKAVLDVFEEEPLPVKSLLWEHPGVLLTPHNSALSFPEQISAVFVENYKRYVAGQPLQYLVNFDQGY